MTIVSDDAAAHFLELHAIAQAADVDLAGIDTADDIQFYVAKTAIDIIYIHQ